MSVRKVHLCICFLNDFSKAPLPHIPAQRRVLQTVHIFIGLLDSFAGSKTGTRAAVLEGRAWFRDGSYFFTSRSKAPLTPHSRR